MKYLKTAFLIALFNYFVIGSIALAFNHFGKSEVAMTSPSQVGVINIPTPEPTQTPTVVATPTQKKIVAAKQVVDPFAGIFSGSAPTSNQTTSTTNNSAPNNNPTTVPAAASNPTTPPQQQQQQPAAPTADTRCIITVHGSRYDVTVFRNQHSGGNVFTCGAEMTSVFDSQHPMSFLNRMTQYKI